MKLILSEVNNNKTATTTTTVNLPFYIVMEFSSRNHKVGAEHNLGNSALA